MRPNADMVRVTPSGLDVGRTYKYCKYYVVGPIYGKVKGGEPRLLIGASAHGKVFCCPVIGSADASNTVL